MNREEEKRGKKKKKSISSTLFGKRTLGRIESGHKLILI